MKQKKDMQAKRDQENEAPKEDNSGPTDLLAADDDEDVIF
jgi:hypothetical protein